MDPLPPIPAETLTRARAAYDAWGLDTGNLGGVQTHERLTKNMREAGAHAHYAAYRLIPNSFDAANCEAFPVDASSAWESLRLFAEAWRPGALASIIPHFWQMEPVVHDVCRAVKIPLFVGEPENVPLCAAAIRMAGIEFVIGATADLGRLGTFLAESGGGAPRALLLVHAPDTDSLTIPAPLLRDPHCRIAQEIHVFPGLPLLTQCPHLAEKKRAHYHLSERFVVETHNGKLLVTDSVGPLPLIRYEIPLAAEHAGTCECGRSVLQASPAPRPLSTADEPRGIA